MASHFYFLAASAEITEFSFDGGADQWWTDLLASALSGLVLLPFALLFVWGFHKLRLDRLVVLSAILATVLSVVVTQAVNLYLWGIYAFFEGLLHRIELNRFVYMVFPTLSVCLVGAIGFGWWLKRHRNDDISGNF